jgi:predicted YcjX-like family ATPase
MAVSNWAVTDWLNALDPFPTTVRIGVTGLARAGKTSFLACVAANLLAMGAGQAALPALSARLAGRRCTVRLSEAGAASLPRFALARHLAALAADPPEWPARTDAVSLLSLTLEVGRGGLADLLPARTVTLEFLDYPGEWLLDLPLLRQDFAAFSAAMLERLAPLPAARPFLDFQAGLATAAADEALAETGHRLYRELLLGLRDQGLVWLQPGRFLMPPPGATPPWMGFFPMAGSGGLARLLESRFSAYRAATEAELAGPHFGRVDRLVVLADVLAALHAGPAAWADTGLALRSVAASLGGAWWRDLAVLGPVLEAVLAPLLAQLGGGGGIGRVAFAATKADHVAARQRGNLRRLVQALTTVPSGQARSEAFAIAAVRCTEDFVWQLEGRPVSAVRGRVLGSPVMTRSYPGEVPENPPDALFWQHPFLELPVFEPQLLPHGGQGGVAQLGVDALLAFLLEDVL